MDEKIFGISLKTMFQHEGYGCLCAKDTVNTSPDEAPTVTLKVCPDISTQLLFSYAPKDGLNMTGVSGGIHEKNILGKLLALPKDDVDKHIEFIEKYGFLYPLPANEYTAVEASDLIDIINRIKSTIRLYSCINKKDYKGVLIHVVYLLFASVTELRIGDDVFSTCSHHFKNLLDSYNLFPDLSREPEVAANGTYSVDDAFLGKKNAVDISFYNAVRSGADTNLQGSKDPWFKNLMAMYIGCKDVDEETRFLIDFFYHFQTEVSVIKEVHYGGFKSYTTFNEDALDDSFKNALLKIARIVVAEEINHNIRGIHPKYNGGKLTATWQVDTLIEALYFSIFYMRNGEMYKECENPNCKRDRFFLVEATRTNKHYCCEQCRNAAGAQRYRNRQL
ncbi:hypothetical protein [Faecalicoccus pleomorphus]|jgi:hypothetical protein|uniref:hypothetical protein n=1 Tax=Faecalicoccus pleomorphus TaxID=1323 RepID=UPI002059D5B0|nr:hypothetical protein [Faecalicoccus pleomorphus]DAZ19562.1 MAG TPA: zinc finger protein [Caudoviricetes sp.]